MTCIVGLVDENGTVHMGADSAASSDWVSLIWEGSKIFLKNQMIFGFTTSYQMGQALKYRLLIPKHPEVMDEMEFMTTLFMDAVRKCLDQAGYLKREHDRETGGTFLVGYRGKLYRVSDDFGIGANRDGYDAVGSGEQIALGALFSLQNQKGQVSATRKLDIALTAASRFSLGVRPPFDFLELGSNPLPTKTKRMIRNGRQSKALANSVKIS